MKVLLVDPDGARVAALRETLTGAGAEVAVAPSGAFALTMLERNRQDAIVSRARIDDMEGHELCAILRSDPEARDVRFLLVAAQDETSPAQTAEAGIDLVVPPSMNESLVLGLIVQLVSRDREKPKPAVAAGHEAAPETVVEEPAAEEPAVEEPAVVEPEAAPEPEPAHAAVTETSEAPVPTPAPPPARQLPARTFQGSLGAIGIEELTQAIAVGGKTGRLILAFGEGGGLVAFEAGRVVHAEFKDTHGEDAFAALVGISVNERTGKFCFIPSDAGTLTTIPKTIAAKSVDQLLLSAATELDSRAPAGAHTSAEER